MTAKEFFGEGIGLEPGEEIVAKLGDRMEAESFRTQLYYQRKLFKTLDSEMAEMMSIRRDYNDGEWKVKISMSGKSQFYKTSPDGTMEDLK